jgi:hypothetical protein
VGQKCKKEPCFPAQGRILAAFYPIFEPQWEIFVKAFQANTYSTVSLGGFLHNKVKITTSKKGILIFHTPGLFA